MPAISVKNLTKRYGSVAAISGVSFEVGRGEVVGFLGPNGAGKSTTMRILAGLQTADSGTADICGESVALRPEVACRHLGYMPENNPLPEDLRVTEYLRFRAKLKGVPRGEVAGRVDEAMEACDLVRKARRRLIGTLSKGFRQRVGIADSLLGSPDAIVLDEPTIGLDPHQILGIRRLINSLRGKMAVLISSHILPEIEQICDRVIIINQGRIVASGTTEALRNEFIPNVSFEILGTMSAEALKTLLQTRDPAAKIAGGEEARDGARRFRVSISNESPLVNRLLEVVYPAFPGEIRELSLKQPSLEDVFIAATRRSWEISAAEGSSREK